MNPDPNSRHFQKLMWPGIEPDIYLGVGAGSPGPNWLTAWDAASQLPTQIKFWTGPTWQTAWDIAYAGGGVALLKNWFIANTGSNVPLTAGSLSGNQNVTTQAGATGLLGKTITGTVNSNGVTFSAGENVEAYGFKVVSPALTRASSHHCNLLWVTSSAFNVYIHHFEVDGLDYTGALGIGGDTFADHITIRYANVHGTGFDGLRMGKNTLAEFVFVHDLPNYDLGGYDAYQGNGDFDLYPHLDAVTPQHSGCILRSCYIENNTGSSATSGGLYLNQNTNRIKGFLAENTVFSGGGTHCLTVTTESQLISDPGKNGYPEDVIIRNNIIIRDSWTDAGIGSSLWANAGVPSGTREDTGTKLITVSDNHYEDGNPVEALPTITTPKFYHFFEGASGTFLENTVAMWGGAWTQHPQYAGATTKFKFDANGRVYSPSPGNCMYLPNTPASADYKVGAYFIKPTSTGAADTPGICLRMHETDNTMYQLRWKEAATSQWQIRSIVAGVATIIATFDDTFVIGRTAFVELKATGTTIEGYIDGVLRLTATDSAISAAGHPGLLFSNSQTSTGSIHVILIVSV